MTDISELIERVRRGGSSNELDVEIEIALFKPDADFKSARANAAGTKVIYTDHKGQDVTFRAQDWTMSLPDRHRAISLLLSLQSEADK